MTHDNQYSESVLDEMQRLYGNGYLSPGGAEEVEQILDGVTVRDRRVLDLGCGVGGAAIRLVRKLGAGSVLGLDVEEPVLERAAAAVKTAGLSERITFELVVPGPMPLADESVDVVFCKDVICHLPDKGPLFSEVGRVLRKGGLFALGDWTAGDSPHTVRRPDGLILHFESLERYVRGLEQSGFAPVITREHSAWLLERTRSELQTALRLRGEHPASAALEDRIEIARRRLEALDSGLREHWYIQASKP